MDVKRVQEEESGRSMNVTTELRPVLFVRIYKVIFIQEHKPSYHEQRQLCLK